MYISLYFIYVYLYIYVYTGSYTSADGLIRRPSLAKENRQRSVCLFPMHYTTLAMAMTRRIDFVLFNVWPGLPFHSAVEAGVAAAASTHGKNGWNSIFAGAESTKTNEHWKFFGSVLLVEEDDFEFVFIISMSFVSDISMVETCSPDRAERR